MKNAFLSPSAAARVDCAGAWLAEQSPSDEILIVAANREAASEILRRKVLGSDSGATFGWQRVTLDRLAGEIAGDTLAEEGRVPLTRLGVEGVGRFRCVPERPRTYPTGFEPVVIYENPCEFDDRTLWSAAERSGNVTGGVSIGHSPAARVRDRRGCARMAAGSLEAAGPARRA
jgi:hypothetical protein